MNKHVFTYLKQMSDSLFLPLRRVDFLLKSCPPMEISNAQSISHYTTSMMAVHTDQTLIMATQA